jgi:hypothetical protein
VESFDVARYLVREGFRGPAVNPGGGLFQPGETIRGKDTKVPVPLRSVGTSRRRRSKRRA